MKLEEVEIHRAYGDFVTCDLCSTSIPDLHMACRSCARGDEGGTDVCMDCVREARGRNPYFWQRVTSCKTCYGNLELTRIMSTQMIKALRRIADKYGDIKDRPMMPLFSYPCTDPEQSEVKVHFGYPRKDETRATVQLIVQKPPDLNAHLTEMNQSAQRVMEECEAKTAHLEHLIDWREAGNGNCVRCVDASKCDSADLHELLKLCIWRGEPLIMKNVRGVMDWRPRTMTRVFTDRRNRVKKPKKSKKRSFALVDDSSDDNSTDTEPEVGPNDVCVVKCAPGWPMTYWRQSDFFSIYERGPDSIMYKIKDWPPDESFEAKLTRHYQDFVEMLPCPKYTNPISGMLNLTRALPEYRLRPDIGPKTYLATGRLAERGKCTDSVTQMHLDMTDAINILLHAQSKTEKDEGSSAAIWTVISRADIASVTEYLKDPNAINERKTYLSAADIHALTQQHGAQIWTFEQFQNDAVYVPSGCPHQVRNTRSCLKVAVDFFPPESTAVVMELVEFRRRFANRVQNNQDKDVADGLQGTATLMYACHEAYKVSKKRLSKFAVVDNKQERKWRKVEVGEDSSEDEDCMDVA